MFFWFETVLYLNPISEFIETTERPGYFLGFVDDIGDVLTFKILKNDSTTVKHRRVVRSAVDPNHRKRQITFNSDVQEKISKLDTRPSNQFKNSHNKHNSRKFNDNASIRTSSKASHMEQIGAKTKSKIQTTCNLSVQSLFFLLYDMVSFKRKRILMIRI
jgi:hypothetical protein